MDPRFAKNQFKKYFKHKKQCDNIIKIFSRIKKMQALVFDLFILFFFKKKKSGGNSMFQ